MVLGPFYLLRILLSNQQNCVDGRGQSDKSEIVDISTHFSQQSTAFKSV